MTEERRGSLAPSPRTGWFVGVVVFLFLVYILVNSLRSQGPSVHGLQAGQRLPAFAAPLALSDLEGDANVARRANQGGAGSRPACAVRGPKILNLCQLSERGPVVLAFMPNRDSSCADQLDVVERVYRDFPDVRFAAVAFRGGRSDLRRLIRKRGWSFPVAYDHDGAVASIYGIAVCSELTFAYPGRVAMRTTLRKLDAAQLRAQVRRLLAGARARGWRPGK